MTGGSFLLKVADLPIVSVAVFEAKKEAHEKATKESEKLPTVTTLILSVEFFDATLDNCRLSQEHIALPVARTSKV